MILYNVPGRTVADLANETTLRLAQVPGIVGIKDATADLGRGSELLHGARRGGQRDFAVYSGDDITALAADADGRPRRDLGHRQRRADADGADVRGGARGRRRARRARATTGCCALHRKLFVEANPIPVKWALAEMGLIQNELRLPLVPLSPQYHETVRAALRDAGCLALTSKVSRMHAARIRPLRARGRRCARVAIVALAGCESLTSLARQEDRLQVGVAARRRSRLPPDLTTPQYDDRYNVADGVGARRARRDAAARRRRDRAERQRRRADRARRQRALAGRARRRPSRRGTSRASSGSENGFVLAIEQPQLGVMETDWAENRAEHAAGLPAPARSASSSTSSTRPTSATSSARASSAAPSPARSRSTSRIAAWSRCRRARSTTRRRPAFAWAVMPPNPGLEAEMLTRLMVSFGTPRAAGARAAVAAATRRRGAGARAHRQERRRHRAGSSSTTTFDRAWRRVGLALDRVGFTVVDRDRSQGRLLRPLRRSRRAAKKDDAGWLAKLMFWKDDDRGQARAVPDRRRRSRRRQRSSGAGLRTARRTRRRTARRSSRCSRTS